jgi:hypothetical protein
MPFHCTGIDKSKATDTSIEFLKNPALDFTFMTTPIHKKLIFFLWCGALLEIFLNVFFIGIFLN